jgi:hypothetical protein
MVEHAFFFYTTPSGSVPNALSSQTCAFRQVQAQVSRNETRRNFVYRATGSGCLVAEDLHLPDMHPAAVALPLQADLCPDQIALEGVGFALANGRCVAATLGPVALDLLLRRIF